MKRYTDNGFCELFMNVYDFYIKEGIYKEPEIKEDIIKEPKGLLSFFNKKKDKVINDTLDNIVIDSKYQSLLDTKNHIIEEWFTAKGISFSVLWDFIEFIDFAKKSILYSDKNDKFRSYIKIDDKTKIEHRYLSIQQTEETSFIFDLYYANKIECIKISKITNEDKHTLIISDEHIDFNDESDIYLINTINYILCRECRRKMKIIFESLKEVFII